VWAETAGWEAAAAAVAAAVAAVVAGVAVAVEAGRPEWWAGELWREEGQMWAPY